MDQNVSCSLSHLLYISFTLISLIVVSVPAKIVKRGAKTRRVAKGRSIVLSCQIEGSPKPELVWLKYRQIVESSRRELLMQCGDLNLSTLKYP